MNVLVDVDNTLWDCGEELYRSHCKEGFKVPPPTEWHEFGYYKKYMSDEEFYKQVHKIHLNQEQYKPFHDASKFLRNLNYIGYTIIIASHREADTYDALKRWLDYYHLCYDDIHVSWDKTELFPSLDLCVDDNPETIIASVNEGIPTTGLVWPWNKHLSKKVPLFKSLDDLFKYFVIQNTI